MVEGRAPRATGYGLVPAVAHELRSSIAAVRGAAGQLRARGDRLDPETRDRLLAVIEDAGEQLLRLADDLAALGPMETGRLRVDLEPCDATAVVRQALESAGVAVTETSTLRLAVEEPLPAVLADPGRLRQVVSNLVENALRHSPPGTPIDVSLTDTPGGVRIAVRDGGPGIPRDQLLRIFEPGVRLSPAPGSGLGLAIVRELTEAMGGTVSVQSEPGRGSEFIVEFPAA